MSRPQCRRPAERGGVRARSSLSALKKGTCAIWDIFSWECRRRRETKVCEMMTFPLPFFPLGWTEGESMAAVEAVQHHTRCSSCIFKTSPPSSSPPYQHREIMECQSEDSSFPMQCAIYFRRLMAFEHYFTGKKPSRVKVFVTCPLHVKLSKVLECLLNFGRNRFRRPQVGRQHQASKVFEKKNHGKQVFLLEA